jgi:hypothetical protein
MNSRPFSSFSGYLSKDCPAWAGQRWVAWPSGVKAPL